MLGVSDLPQQKKRKTKKKEAQQIEISTGGKQKCGKQVLYDDNII